MSEAVGESTVGAQHLGDPLDVCPVCGGFGERSPRALLQADPPVHMLACGRCGAASADRLPDEAYLKALYAPDQYASDLLSSHDNTRRCAEHIAACLPLDAGGDVHVLDYGGSDGGLSRALIEALRARGHRGEITCTVVDYFVDERAAGGVTFLDLNDFAQSDARYDVVLASAVLEHLTDLPGTAARLLAACRPGGYFYARTPYELPLAGLVPGYRVRWPRHLHDLGPRFWAHFLERFGYRGEVLRSAPSVVETDFATRPLRTLLAHLLKAPGHLEARVLPARVVDQGRVFWPLVGGWEVVLRVDADLRSGAVGAAGSAVGDEQ